MASIVIIVKCMNLYRDKYLLSNLALPVMLLELLYCSPLRRLKKESPNAEITWITYFPEALSQKWLDNILNFNLQNILWLQAQKFDWLINLDKDREALALCSLIKANRKSGFTLDDFGKCKSISNKAEKDKWLTGLWDDLNISNKKNYMEEIFNVCGYNYLYRKYYIINLIMVFINLILELLVIILNSVYYYYWSFLDSMENFEKQNNYITKIS